MYRRLELRKSGNMFAIELALWLMGVIKIYRITKFGTKTPINDFDGVLWKTVKLKACLIKIHIWFILSKFSGKIIHSWLSFIYKSMQRSQTLIFFNPNTDDITNSAKCIPPTIENFQIRLHCIKLSKQNSFIA